MKNLIPTEYDEQCALVEWLEIKGYKFTAIPNSTWTTSMNQKMRNKKSGLRAGLPDMLVIHPKGLVFIELKRTKGGQVSEFQKEWIDALQNCKNVGAFVCYGCNEAINLLENL